MKSILQLIALVGLMILVLIQIQQIVYSIGYWLGVVSVGQGVPAGMWDRVILNVLLFLLFLALVPIRLRGSWKAHGMYAAFVISLFTEMFGVPLTAYFIITYFHRITFERDFLTYLAAYGQPIGSILVILGAFLIAIGWFEVYSRGRSDLVTTGIYGYVRHPQYLGIILVTLGYLIIWPTILTMVMWPVLVLLYWRQAKKEEEYLVKLYGDRYLEYASRTPMFIPLRFRFRINWALKLFFGVVLILIGYAKVGYLAFSLLLGSMFSLLTGYPVDTSPIEIYATIPFYLAGVVVIAVGLLELVSSRLG